MTPERYQQIKALYEAAAGCETTQRTALLDEACGNDQALRRAVETLLADRNEAETFLETPAYRFANGRDEAKLQVGQRIGAYKLLQEIGYGGMGAVWLAQRADEQYQKRVAIKLIKRGMDTDEILQRFRYERQILASLDHPNIARLLDGGTTSDGLPYFVMEHIEGQPIDRYCDAHKLTTIERLRLFRTVCAAVQFAHQNLVVHRDLKPSNILVTEDGTVKLLDFGIAKILNPAMFPSTVAPTALHERPMTPAYASPEQVRGEPISTASDVYSLGVILYELLTGHRPYQITSAAPQEIERIVCNVEPDRPSTLKMKDEGGGMNRKFRLSSLIPHPSSLRNDLDNIVLMALRKEASRRYASVEQFSADIRRYLTGLPIIAREDTLSYRVSKFIARNKAAVALTSLVSLLILGFLITTLVQSARIRRERDRAEAERAKAEKVSSFLVDLFKVNDPSESRGNSVTAREILDKGAQKIGTELRDQPETQAKLMDTMGMAYDGLGLYPQALPLVEQALTTRQRIFGAAHIEVAESLRSLAEVKFNQGEFDVAAEKSRAALDILRKEYGNEHLKVAHTFSDLGLVLLFKGDPTGAEPPAREAVAIMRKLPNATPNELLPPISNFANVLRQNRKFSEATQYQEEALALSRKALGNDHPNTIIVLGGLALLLSDGENPAKDYARAESLSREALAGGRRVLPPEHSQTIYNLIDLGSILIKRDNAVAAETTLREAAALANKVLPPDHFRRIHAQHMLGRCLAAQKRYAEAEPLLLGSWQTFQRMRGAQDRWTNIAREELVKLYEAWGKPEKAISYRSSQ